MTGIIQDCSSNIQIGMDNDTRMISRLRTYMMGVSILWVVLFHTSGIFILPPALRSFQNTGYLGVDIFFKSEWRHDRLEGENATTFKQRIRNYLVRHCLYTPPTIYEIF